MDESGWGAKMKINDRINVLVRLPCYDFAPVINLTVVGCLLAVSSPASGKTNFHGVTGGVYKARERIHRSVLICDY